MKFKNNSSTFQYWHWNEKIGDGWYHLLKSCNKSHAKKVLATILQVEKLRVYCTYFLYFKFSNDPFFKIFNGFEITIKHCVFCTNIDFVKTIF
jgi:hypothetical protein